MTPFSYRFPNSEPNTSFLLTPGFYRVSIKHIKEKTTKNGGVMFNCTFQVTNQILDGKIVLCQKVQVFHNIVLPAENDDIDKANSMLSRVATFLKVLGEEYKGNVEINHHRWLDKIVAIKLKNIEYAGDLQNNVEYILSVEKAIANSRHQSTSSPSPKMDLKPDFDLSPGDNDDINNEDLPF